MIIHIHNLSRYSNIAYICSNNLRSFSRSAPSVETSENTAKKSSKRPKTMSMMTITHGDGPFRKKFRITGLSKPT